MSAAEAARAELERSVLAILPASEAPAATPEPTADRYGTGVYPRDRFTVIVAWEPGFFRYDLDPTSGAVASIPVRDGCRASGFGDVHYLRGAVFSWRRGKFVVTPEGADFLLGKKAG